MVAMSRGTPKSSITSERCDGVYSVIRIYLSFLAFFLAISLVRVAHGYPLKPPEVRLVASPNGNALLRIDPGFAGPARATIFTFDPNQKTYRFSSTFDLRNRVEPDKALITDKGDLVVTFDDWDVEIGCTPNVVVIYRASGEVLKSWSLEDIFTQKEIDRFGPFASNVPTRRWRGENPELAVDSTGPFVNIPWRMDGSWRVGLRLDLLSLTFEKLPTSTP